VPLISSTKQRFVSSRNRLLARDIRAQPPDQKVILAQRVGYLKTGPASVPGC